MPPGRRIRTDARITPGALCAAFGRPDRQPVPSRPTQVDVGLHSLAGHPGVEELAPTRSGGADIPTAHDSSRCVCSVATHH